ncbi:lipase family protein [Luteipulveratus mongoliensis]|uniref:Triacylglycerol lipase n=1 Tax=Luteipulveratus mongoliensis TaxID=571913 RepID=A0A0K1JNW1_9MICO|nr:lipase family protein [Luteipulveratus mongoliensis]AKU18273.1 hypothetical protein VV02_24520 [Luteipulveratus mongoliensis]
MLVAKESHRWPRRIAVGTAALVAAAVVQSAPAVAASVPVPDDDPFYAVPSGIADLANGSVLDSRPVAASAVGIPINATAWQVKYKTIDQHNQPSAFVTTVLVPKKAWTGSGERPLVSYQTAEDGVGTKCSPSYLLRAGLEGGLNGAETLLVAETVNRGFAVSVPDYEGPNSEFGGAEGSAHGVLDGVRAARNFTAAGISKNAPVGLVGYSGGSLATNWALKAQASYAPELTFAGAASGGTVGDVKVSFQSFINAGLGGAALIPLIGLQRAYPEKNIQQYLNASGLRAIAGSQTDCITEAALKHPLANLNPAPIGWGKSWGTTNDPGFSKVFADVSPLTMPGAPKTPVLFYHSVIDEFAPVGKMRALFKQYCAAGVTASKTESLVGEHEVYAITGLPTALDYLGDRFAGKPAPNDC